MTPGSEFGRYRIESVIRHGGMGIIYLATDTRLQRRVALKVLGEAWRDQPDYRERFLRESRLAASLDHPHILPIFEAGETAGLPFLAMRYVDGSALDEVIREHGPMEPVRAVSLVAQIGDALDAAHGAGLIHRDVKPSNILVAETISGEHAYLTDFGVTKSMVDPVAMTRTGDLVGTLEYIAPEQIEGRTVDQRVDVYSLACVLYELLAGRRPFQGATQAALLYAHLQSPRPSIRELRPDISDKLDETLQRGMAVDPAQRPESAGALAREALQAIEGDPLPANAHVPAAAVALPEGPTVVVPRTARDEKRPWTHGNANRKRRNQGLVIAATAILLALLGGVAFLGDRLAGGAQPTTSPDTSGRGGSPPVGDERGFSCSRQELTAPSEGRWRLWRAEYGARADWDYLRLNLRRQGDHEQVASAVLEVVAPDQVEELTEAEPPPDADAVLVIGFNGAVTIGGPWQAQPNHGALREFRITRGREGNVYAIVGVRGDGCFNLGGQAWEPGGQDGSFDLTVEIQKR